MGLQDVHKQPTKFYLLASKAKDGNAPCGKVIGTSLIAGSMQVKTKAKFCFQWNHISISCFG